MASFLDSYETLLEQSLHISEEKEYKFSLFRHKKNNTMSIGLREFKHTASYDGVNGKNGMMLVVRNYEDIDNYIKWLTTALEEAKSKVDK